MKEERIEDALGRLETLVNRLESGQVALDEAIELFEQGISEVTSLRARLDAAELRVTEVLERNGMLESRTIDPDA